MSTSTHLCNKRLLRGSQHWTWKKDEFPGIFVRNILILTEKRSTVVVIIFSFFLHHLSVFVLSRVAFIFGWAVSIWEEHKINRTRRCHEECSFLVRTRRPILFSLSVILRPKVVRWAWKSSDVCTGHTYFCSSVRNFEVKVNNLLAQKTNRGRAEIGACWLNTNIFRFLS